MTPRKIYMISEEEVAVRIQAAIGYHAGSGELRLASDLLNSLLVLDLEDPILAQPAISHVRDADGLSGYVDCDTD